MVSPPPLLDLEGLRQMARLMAAYRQAGRLYDAARPDGEER